MSVASNRILIFRLGEIGFLLDLAEVVEVVDQGVDALDPGRSDIGRGIVSALLFRQTWIPVVDPALKLDIFSTMKLKEKTVVVLRGTEGNWALLVDRVSKLSAAEKFQPCEIPFLLKIVALGFYSQIQLLDNEPIIVFEPERYYGSVPLLV
ncbi:MAG: chemotaxis protein CheW [Desulfuromusa sp.]|nr:chemotaxis protein CheW [Desulfuromusa sp.]